MRLRQKKADSFPRRGIWPALWSRGALPRMGQSESLSCEAARFPGAELMDRGCERHWATLALVLLLFGLHLGH